MVVPLDASLGAAVRLWMFGASLMLVVIAAAVLQPIRNGSVPQVLALTALIAMGYGVLNYRGEGKP